jgi:dihydroxyacetone kinase-like protein
MTMATAVRRMRKFVNDPEQLVKEALVGVEAAHGDLLRYDREAQILVSRRAPRKGKVALISGGGSGHEPLHGGFVGLGMLDAACPGEVFTSPVPDQMVAATKAVDGGAGVVHIVKNYTGDVLNFKMAADEVADDGINVEAVVMDDDVAVQDSLYTAGRRGVGATVLAEKIAGAAAERGDDLAAVAGIARRVNERARSFGIALSSCIPPSSGSPIFDLPEGEMEVGIGIHGEPGRRRAPLGSASEIGELLVEAVISDLRPASGANLLVFLNGMGGTPQLELYLLYAEVERRLRGAGFTASRSLVGSYITSLEMAGASLTVLELDDATTALWDAPVHTAALRWGV